MYCTRCGSVNADTARFCSACGSTFAPAGPGAPPVAAVAAAPAFAQATHVRYAGFWRRLVAMFIDGLVFSPLVVICLAVTGVFGAILQPGGGDIEGLATAMFSVGILLAVVVFSVANWLYNTWMESSPHQATLGKKAMGIIVTDMNGNRISFARSNGRFFGKWISGMIMNIGYLMAAFTEKKQALHDILAGCLVVMK
jgi:uncharacterized RDD family membrane protein YckC